LINLGNRTNDFRLKVKLRLEDAAVSGEGLPATKPAAYRGEWDSRLAGVKRA